jgi:hypothetical protein
MQQTLVGGTAVSEISSEELALVSGGQYAAIQPSAVGTSGALPGAGDTSPARATSKSATSFLNFTFLWSTS